MPISWISLGSAAVVAALSMTSLHAAHPVPWDLEALKTPPRTFPAPSLTNLEGVKSVFFEGLPFQGKPTKVFAFYGVPADASGKVPGIVLVHGGGGTARADWVKLWMDRGYAAIAFDHFGGLPDENGRAGRRNPEGGPDIGGPWQMAWPVTDQWMYHAIADTMLAASFLASLPGVDPDRIGLTGISWGGIISSNVAGLDPRFRFVAPVYGCGFIAHPWDDGSQFVGRKDSPELLARWRDAWDPASVLARAEMPILWINGTNDFAFTPRIWQMSRRLAPGSRHGSFRHAMEHSQGAGQAPEEIRVFADSVVRGGPPLVRITSQGLDGDKAWVEYDSPVPLKSAELLFTRQSSKWQNRRWETIPAAIDPQSRRVSVVLPDDATIYAFQLLDERGLLVSSDLQPEKSFALPTHEKLP